ncbi:MAG: chemotaxis protein CheC [Oscillospiraceae bacterium]|jgi:chemotaxis protein CheC|nr:chemotaxis protein CheC [Oscillospiraceae bacterium]
MNVKGYDQLSSLELDTLREVGSIGTGNAATALSTLLNKEVRIALPEVRFMGYNEAIEWMGGPEVVTAGVLVGMSNQMSGIMLSVQHLEFINLVLESMLGDPISDYAELDEMRQSTLVEVGNIMISTFINALSGLSDISVNLTVPAFAVDMQGAILSVPMAEYGGTSDYIMTIAGHFVCDGKQVPCHLILSPDLRSLNFLLKKLGVAE